MWLPTLQFHMWYMLHCFMSQTYPALHFNFARVGPGWRNFNGTHNSGCLHGHHWPHQTVAKLVAWWEYSSKDTDGKIVTIVSTASSHLLVSELHFAPQQKFLGVEGHCHGGYVDCPRTITSILPHVVIITNHAGSP